MQWPMRGRATELGRVLEHLSDGTRLVTISGPAGVGKSMLATAVQRQLTVSGRRTALLDAAGPLPAHPSPVEVFVIDSPPGDPRCVADFVRAVLERAPAAAVVAAARAPLGLAGERAVRVDPLPVPDVRGTGAIGEDTLEESPALALFVDRARAVRPDFSLDRATAASAVAVCRRLQGLPLAIHLAALHSRLFTPAAMLAELERPFEFLSEGFRASDDPARSLRASVEAGLAGLDDRELVLLRAIAAFPQGSALANLRAAAAWIDSAHPVELLTMLGSLVDAGALDTAQDPDGGTRFRLPPLHSELIGACTPGAAQALIDGITRALIEQCRAAVGLHGNAWDSAAAIFDAEYDNLMRLIIDARDGGQPAGAIEMIDLVCRFWLHRGRIEEALEIVEPLEHEKLDLLSQARLVGALGILHAHHYSFTSAYGECTRAVALWRQIGDHHRLAGALLSFSTAALEVDGWLAARAAVEEAVELFTALGDDWAIARATAQLGALAATERGEGEFARECLERSASMLQALNDQAAANLPLQQLGRLMLEDGDTESARLVLEHGLAEMRVVGDHFSVSAYLNLLGLAEMALGFPARASNRYLESLRIAVSLGLKGRAVWCLEGLAESLAALGADDDSATAAASAMSLRDELDLHGWVEFCSPHRPGAERGAAIPRAVRIARVGGASWPPRAVLLRVPLVLTELAEAAVRPMPSAEHSATSPAGLTARELEILGLIGSGMTSRAIADRLFISIDTVGRHITNLYRKIGARGRADATAYAVRLQLLPAEP